MFNNERRMSETMIFNQSQTNIITINDKNQTKNHTKIQENKENKETKMTLTTINNKQPKYMQIYNDSKRLRRQYFKNDTTESKICILQQ